MAQAAVAAAASFDASEADREDAEKAARAMSRLAGQARVRVVAVANELPAQTFILPAPAVRLLADILAHLAQGRSVAVLPEDALLTTQQAADFLNVSRPYLIGLLNAEAIPFHTVGTHRRVRLDNLLAFRDRRIHERRRILDELTAEAQDLDMGY